ncbi:MAG: maltokinase N-terminal cap-like domain-containing protein [Jatrophihabitans sp.]|uniref:maltokinase N-terminal cap-like domain-containing protein n=1 Tax=Jatrophihabitans sp. TaxID=1932789 RepID=UPI003F7F4886
MTAGMTADQIRPLLDAWLPQQRWFGGKGRDIAGLSAEPLGPVGEATVWIATVEYVDGVREQYQVPLVLKDEVCEPLAHVLLGTVDGADGPRWVYDALHDKEITGAWLTGVRDEQAGGPIAFHRSVAADDIPVEAASLVMSGEQSNTSLVFDDTAIMKVFRRLQPGVNPDVEVTERLTELGAKHIPRLFGHVTAELPDGTTSLAMLQEFMTTASDGWQQATHSVLDLMAEADLHADEAGGDFAAEAERLGMAVAETHADLARAFGTDRMSAADWAKRVDLMRSKLDDALAVVPDLAELEDGIRGLYDEAAEAGAAGLPVQRIHGDLHLGQVLRTVYRWVLIDFEGEPMADIASRREYDSPLRDVAGMLRSFTYAGYHRLVEELSPTPQLQYRAEEWSQRNRAAYLDGYASAEAADGGDAAANADVIRAFEVEKAVYEAVYEARNRPSWLTIPLTSLRVLVTPPASTGGNA